MLYSLHHISIFSNTNIKSIPHPSLIYVLILRFVLVRQSSSLAMVRHPRSFNCFIFTPVHQIIDNNGMVHNLSLVLFKIQHLGILYKRNQYNQYFFKDVWEGVFLITLSKWYKLYKCSLLKTKICSEGMHKTHSNEIYNLNLENSESKISRKSKPSKHVAIILTLNHLIKGSMYESDVSNSSSEEDERFESPPNFRPIQVRKRLLLIDIAHNLLNLYFR